MLQAYPEVKNLNPHCQGALLSLVINRGTDMGGPAGTLRWDKRKEMRNIANLLSENKISTSKVFFFFFFFFWGGASLLTIFIMITVCFPSLLVSSFCFCLTNRQFLLCFLVLFAHITCSVCPGLYLCLHDYMCIVCLPFSPFFLIQ